MRNEWISVNDKLPNEGEIIEVSSLKEDIFINLGNRKTPFRCWSNITHWRYTKEEKSMSDEFVKFETKMPPLDVPIWVKLKDGEIVESKLQKSSLFKDGFHLSVSAGCINVDYAYKWKIREEGTSIKFEVIKVKKMDNKQHEDKWINLKDEMPKLNQRIKIKFESGKEHESQLIISEGSLYFSTFMGNAMGLHYVLDVSKIIGWRPLKEKSPDFDKLKDGDRIFIYYHHREEIYGGIFKGISGNYINLCFHKILETIGFSKENIKRIIRINLEDKTFEDI